jgi:hypothetical protein
MPPEMVESPAPVVPVIEEAAAPRTGQNPPPVAAVPAEASASVEMQEIPLLKAGMEPDALSGSFEERLAARHPGRQMRMF